MISYSLLDMSVRSYQLLLIGLAIIVIGLLILRFLAHHILLIILGIAFIAFGGGSIVNNYIFKPVDLSRISTLTSVQRFSSIDFGKEFIAPRAAFNNTIEQDATVIANGKKVIIPFVNNYHKVYRKTSGASYVTVQNRIGNTQKDREYLKLLRQTGDQKFSTITIYQHTN